MERRRPSLLSAPAALEGLEPRRLLAFTVQHTPDFAEAYAGTIVGLAASPDGTIWYTSRGYFGNSSGLLHYKPGKNKVYDQPYIYGDLAGPVTVDRKGLA